MKFTGQLKIPDLDAPGVPAAVHIDDNQTEIMVQGESLGRWSLVDVRAERLVASAFSLKLDDEEVTFIADEPTDFAYRGVEHMANVWARYKTMTLPRRTVASARSRKGTKVSRISDLRTAIEETIAGETVSAPSQGKVPGETAVAPPPTRAASDLSSPAKEQSTPVWEPGPAEDELPEAALPDSITEHVEPAESVESHPAAEPEPTPTPSEPPTVDPQSVPGRHEVVQAPTEIPVHPVQADEPGAGVLPETRPEFEEPPAATVEPAEPESVFKDTVPWATAQTSSSQRESVPLEPAEPDTPEQDLGEPAGRLPDSETTGPATEALPSVSPISQPPAAAGTGEAEVPKMPEPEPASAVPWIDPSANAEPPVEDSPVQEQVEVHKREPESTFSNESTPGADGEPEDREPKYVVDLGAFEDRGVTPPDDGQHDDAEPALAGVKEKAGLMGAVRSAFVRNREEHTHDYVQAPGGLGIVRQICTECGHISIGVAE